MWPAPFGDFGVCGWWTCGCLTLAAQQWTPQHLAGRMQAALLKNRHSFLKYSKKAKMLFLTTAKKTTWMLLRMRCIVTAQVSSVYCAGLWNIPWSHCAGYLSPLLLALLLFWPTPHFQHAISNPSFLLLISEGLCTSILCLNASASLQCSRNSTSACNSFLCVLALTVLILLVLILALVLHTE